MGVLLQLAMAFGLLAVVFLTAFSVPHPVTFLILLVGPFLVLGLVGWTCGSTNVRTTLVASTTFGVVTMLVSSWLFRGSWLAEFVLSAGKKFVLLSAGIGAAAIVVGKWWRPQLLRRFGAGVVGTAWVFVLQLPSVPLGRLLTQQDIRTAHRYCEALIPVLEAKRQQTGTYPESGWEFDLRYPKRPRLLRDEGWYRSDGTTFLFEVPDPSSLRGADVYRSKSRKWTRVFGG